MDTDLNKIYDQVYEALGDGDLEKAVVLMYYVDHLVNEGLCDQDSMYANAWIDVNAARFRQEDAAYEEFKPGQFREVKERS